MILAICRPIYLFFLEKRQPTDCLAVGGPRDGKPCVFPFEFDGTTYSTCTNRIKYKTNNLPWCSTKVDKKGKHISHRNRWLFSDFYSISNSNQGNWGNCDETCPLPTDEKETDSGLLINMCS